MLWESPPIPFLTEILSQPFPLLTTYLRSNYLLRRALYAKLSLAYRTRQKKVDNLFCV